jgi:hypothetical protein
VLVGHSFCSTACMNCPIHPLTWLNSNSLVVEGKDEPTQDNEKEHSPRTGLVTQES